ncbi:glycine zipper family protein [Variovorax sp. LT1R20]|uniref:glycine zipper family protein n=1 Tax=Variovorax sp. LT1R20 TaxID=3443729 RepID=UPI003F44696C
MQEVTLAEVIETSLGIALNLEEIKKFDFNHQNISDLAKGVGEFHEIFSLPEKFDSEFRPSISPAFGQDHSIGFGHVSGVPGQEVESAIKKYLLFSHGLVFEDPLIYLLDYFRDGAEDEYSRVRIPRVRDLLIQYAKVAELIRMKIVFPVTGEPNQIDRIEYLDSKQVDEISKRLPDMEKVIVQLCCQKIAEERYSLSTFGNRADYFFPRPEYVRVLHEIVKLEKASYVRQDLDRPFGMSVIGSISSIDPNEVSIQDLVSIRLNDALFSDWRDFLDRSFGELRQNEAQYSDVNREYLALVRANFDAWDKKIAGQLSKGALGKIIRKSVGEISYGVFSGAAVGASVGATLGTSGAVATGVMGAIAGGLTGGVTGAIKTGIDKAKDLVVASSSERKTKIIRNHFMALGAIEKQAVA